MKALKIHLKLLALFFSVLILLQGCTLYKPNYFTLHDASKTNNKVLVRTKNNEKLKFKRIKLQHGQYYGVQKIKRIPAKIPLDSAEINYVRIKDKTTSTIFNSVLGLAGVIGVLGIVLWIEDH
ncbi:MAG: hypothetical protein P8X62_12455 [Flavobacteriaceae bacterium]